MLIHLTEEQQMLQQVAREFTQNEIAPRDKWMDDNGFDWDLCKKITEAGFMGANIPEQYGGGGGGIVDTTIIAQEFAKGSASIATFMGGHWLASNLILENGTEEQRQKYMPLAVAGKIFAFGLTEANAGSDAAGIKSLAVETEDGWVLNGSKAWITNSGVADYYIILAMTDPEQGTNGISAFILPKDTEGLAVGKFEEKMGVRGSATCELAFNNIKLPKDALLGVRGKGFKMAMQTLDIGRISAGVGYPCLAYQRRRGLRRHLPARTGSGERLRQREKGIRQAHQGIPGSGIPLCRYVRRHKGHGASGI